MRNGQGDIIGLFDVTGAVVARYTYDSWGKLVSITDGNGNDKTNDTTFIGYKNPLRYRGYYYDNETGLYYLQSRYYNPEWGRFLNADEFTTKEILGTNLFAYCGNNPLMRIDTSGNIWYDIYGRKRYDDPTDKNFVYDRSSADLQRIEAIYTNAVSYGEGHIYVAEPDYKDSVHLKPADILVIDYRGNRDNPTLTIIDSCRFQLQIQQEAIIDRILDYDQRHPGKYTWGRTKASLLTEWHVHNDVFLVTSITSLIKSSHNDLKKRAQSVDFDRNSESLSYFDYIF